MLYAIYLRGEPRYDAYSTLLFYFSVLQLVVTTRYYAPLCLAKKKQYLTLNITQLRILGLNVNEMALFK